MKTFLVTVPLLYLGICAILYFFQERLIFHPVKLDPDYPFVQFSNIEEKFFTASDQSQIHALHFRVDTPKGIVLYFHGNSGALDNWGYAAEDFTQFGYEVMMPDYPTYGKSTGALSEQKIYEDARLVYQSLLEDWSPQEIVLYGRSLGSGVATELATRVEAKMLILETPYTSIPDMSSKTVPFIPGRWLLNYKFDNFSKIKKVACPIHIFAATRDQLTPHEQALRLAEQAGTPTTNLTSVQGAGHGDISSFSVYHEKLGQLLSD